MNFADRLQSFTWSIRPPAGVMPEGPLFWRMLKKPGMFNARKVMETVAREVTYFAAASHPIPKTGIDLKINQLAATGGASS